MNPPTMVRIAEALRPETPPRSPRNAVFTALGIVFGFAAGWLALQFLDGWQLLAALAMCLGALAGTVIARLRNEPDDDG